MSELGTGLAGGAVALLGLELIFLHLYAQSRDMQIITFTAMIISLVGSVVPPILSQSVDNSWLADLFQYSSFFIVFTPMFFYACKNNNAALVYLRPGLVICFFAMLVITYGNGSVLTVTGTSLNTNLTAPCNTTIGPYQNQINAENTMDRCQIVLIIAFIGFEIASMLRSNVGKTDFLLHNIAGNIVFAIGVWMILTSQILFGCLGKTYVYSDSAAYMIIILFGTGFVLNVLPAVIGMGCIKYTDGKWGRFITSEQLNTALNRSGSAGVKSS